MKQKDLAAGLGISEAMVSKLARRGMPTDSVERAVRWRRRHLEPARMKGMRVDSNPEPPRRPATPPQAPATDQADALQAESDQLRVELVGRLFALAEADFDRYAAELRPALRALPWRLRPRLQVSVEVMERLVAHVPAVIRRNALAAAELQAPVPMSDHDADLLGEFWLACAAGEIEVHDGKLAPVTDDARALLTLIYAEAEAEAAASAS